MLDTTDLTEWANGVIDVLERIRATREQQTGSQTTPPPPEGASVKDATQSIGEEVASTEPLKRTRKNSKTAAQLDDVRARLERIEAAVIARPQQRSTKEWYSTSEVAKLLGKAEFTVREWCRLGRINARKRDSGYGRASEWMISHQELERIRNYGLLPVPKN
jgi:Helix-turn-helix domain